MSEKHETQRGVVESDAEDFINRWSRRKAEATARTAESAETEAVAEEERPQAPQAVEPERPLTDDDMPPLETLDENADLSGFLSPGVSENLRRAALRKVFRSAKFNVCDGLDDYCDDFTSFPVLGDIITADMRHHMARAIERLAEQDDEPGEAAPAAGDGDEKRVAAATDTADTNAGSEGDSSTIEKKDEPHDV
ncbi:MAG: DUF3306 domain-containing protein [Gammaproteobacteria bacterium]